MRDRICGSCKYFHHSEADDNGVCGFMRGSYGGGRTHWDSTCNDYNGERRLKDKIINLVGASGSGKTTIAKELEKKGYNIIESYTTREPRCENEWGHTFIKKAIGHEITPSSNMIAFKKLYDYEYWATKEQYEGKGTSIYVADPEGAKQVVENVKGAEVITIFLGTDEETRFNRMLKQNRTFKESIDRVNKDREIFKVCKYDYTVDADRELEEVLEDVIRIIEND